MKEKTIRTELKTFEGLIRVLKALESRLTDLEEWTEHLHESCLLLRIKRLEERAKGKDSALLELDSRITDLEDRVTEGGH